MDDVGTFDRLAGLYDTVAPRARRAPLRRGFAEAERPVRRVLDLGGGPGRGLRAVEAARGLVLDAAAGMTRRATARGLTAVRGEATRLPLATTSLDAVLLVDALHHMPDHAAVLSEVDRVLRPGGVVVIREFDPETVRGRLLAAVEQTLGFASTFHSPDALASMVAAAGLSPGVVGTGFGYTVTGRARESTADGNNGRP